MVASIMTTRDPFQYPIRRLIVRSREVSKPRYWYFKSTHRLEIWQEHRQHCCRGGCKISERLYNSKYKSRSFETLRDLKIRVLSDLKRVPESHARVDNWLTQVSISLSLYCYIFRICFKMSISFTIRHVDVTPIPAPCPGINSLKLIWRSLTSSSNLRLPNLQLICSRWP